MIPATRDGCGGVRDANNARWLARALRVHARRRPIQPSTRALLMRAPAAASTRRRPARWCAPRHRRALCRRASPSPSPPQYPGLVEAKPDANEIQPVTKEMQETWIDGVQDAVKQSPLAGLLGGQNQ